MVPRSDAQGDSPSKEAERSAGLRRRAVAGESSGALSTDGTSEAELLAMVALASKAHDSACEACEACEGEACEACEALIPHQAVHSSAKLATRVAVHP